MSSTKLTTQLTAYIEGIGLLGPGLTSWQNGRDILSGLQSYQSAKTIVPAPELLPAAERRRASDIVKLTLATSLEAIAAAGLQSENLPSVFSFPMAMVLTVIPFAKCWRQKTGKFHRRVFIIRYITQPLVTGALPQKPWQLHRYFVRLMRVLARVC